MKSDQRASATQSSPDTMTLLGRWTARELGSVTMQLDTLTLPAGADGKLDAAGIDALDTAGAWVLHKLLVRLKTSGAVVNLQGLHTDFERLLQAVTQHEEEQSKEPAVALVAEPKLLERVGQTAAAAWEQFYAMLSFTGESAAALLACVMHPTRMRWRPIFFNVRRAGFDALPIVGMLALLLGVVEEGNCVTAAIRGFPSYDQQAVTHLPSKSARVNVSLCISSR